MFLPVSLLGLSVCSPARAADDAVRRESIEWCDVWMPHMNDHDLPRVMLIGDSITRGYFAGTEERLRGKAYVARITTSKAVGDPALLTEIATFLAEAHFDVVHCNIGMHGWSYTEDQYRDGLPALVAAIRKGAPGAKLIWASTTPVRKDLDPGPQNARIQRRNAIAAQYASLEAIPVDDLHAVISGHADLHSDDVHFNKEGSDLLAGQVAGAVLRLLPAPPAERR